MYSSTHTIVNIDVHGKGRVLEHFILKCFFCLQILNIFVVYIAIYAGSSIPNFVAYYSKSITSENQCFKNSTTYKSKNIHVIALAEDIVRMRPDVPQFQLSSLDVVKISNNVYEISATTYDNKAMQVISVRNDPVSRIHGTM